MALHHHQPTFQMKMNLADHQLRLHLVEDYCLIFSAELYFVNQLEYLQNVLVLLWKELYRHHSY